MIAATGSVRGLVRIVFCNTSVLQMSIELQKQLTRYVPFNPRTVPAFGAVSAVDTLAWVWVNDALVWLVKNAVCIVSNPSFSTIDPNTDHLFACTMQDPYCNLSAHRTSLQIDTSAKTLNCRCFHRYTKDCISRLLLYIVSLPCFLESYLPSGVTIVCIRCDWCFLWAFNRCWTGLRTVKQWLYPSPTNL